MIIIQHLIVSQYLTEPQLPLSFRWIQDTLHMCFMDLVGIIETDVIVNKISDGVVLESLEIQIQWCEIQFIVSSNPQVLKNVSIQ